MKQVILIEDRISRQEIFAAKSNIHLDEQTCLKNIKGGSAYNMYKGYIDSQEMMAYSDFKVIIAHRSALSQHARDFLYNYASLNGKSLVLFSGGISSTSLFTNGEFEFLTLNSADLYSSNLIFFLTNVANGKANLAQLAFGANWELNLLLNFSSTLLKLSSELKFKETGVPANKFRNDLRVSGTTLSSLFDKYDLHFDWIHGNHLVTNPKATIVHLHSQLRQLILRLTATL